MRYYPLTESRAGKWIFGAFFFALLLLARDTLVTTAIVGFYKAQFLMLGLVLLLGVVFLIRNRKEWKSIVKDGRILALLIATAVFLLPMVLKRDWQIMYFSVLLCLYIAVFLSYFISYRDVARYYVVMLAVIGVYSVLATYLLRRLPDAGILPVPVFYNSIGVDFYNFGLAFVSGSYVKNRNFGIFREPGVYQFFIMLALYLNIYTAQWKKERTMWLLNGVLAVSMLSTFATGGVAELALFAVVVFLDRKLYRNKKIVAVVALGIFAVTGVVVHAFMVRNQLYWEIYGMIMYKFSGGAASASDRFNSIFVNLEFFLKHPLRGDTVSAVLHSMDNNTSSTMLMYAIFGIFGGCLHALSWVALVWKREQKVWVNLALLLILFMSFNTQNLIADVFFWLFPCMALVERGLPLIRNRLKKV